MSVETDDLFEAFFEFTYGRPYFVGLVMPKSERGRLNRAVAEATAAGIDADDVRRRGVAYRTVWRDAIRSPQGLLANWSRFAPGAAVPFPPSGRPERGSCDSHVWAVLPEGDVCAVCQIPKSELQGGN